MLSSELIEELAQGGNKRDKARVRQQIHREYQRRKIQRNAVTFGNGQYLYYCPQEAKEKIGKRILEVIKRRKRLNRLFEALRTRRIIPEWHAAKISAVHYQVLRNRKIESLARLLNDLEKLGLGRVVDFTYKGKNHRFLVLPQDCQKQACLTDICKKLEQEQETVDKFISILETSGLGKSFKAKPNSISVPSDALGDCKPYLRAGVEVRSKIMIEVNTLWELQNHDIEGLLDRVHAIRKESRAYSIIVYLLADLKKTAFDRANRIGWKPLRPARVSKLIHAENVRQQGVLFFREASPAKFKNIVRELQSLGELRNLGNYKSIVFEDMVRDYFDEFGYITRRRKKYYVNPDKEVTEFPTKTTVHDFEIDVYASKTNSVRKIVICECKHWLEAVGKEEIDKFVKKLNLLVDYYNPKGEKTKAQIEGFFIASELPPSCVYNAKTKLTVMSADDFQKHAKRELSKKQL